MTQIDYKTLIENAMLGMVRDILNKISQSGLPENHHFLITFFSNSKGVIIPDWMKEKYPDKMTIIIRNWFENLNVLVFWGFHITVPGSQISGRRQRRRRRR